MADEPVLAAESVATRWRGPVMNLDYESWRCPTRDSFDGTTGVSVFCPPEGCPQPDGCARDRGWTPEAGWPTPEQSDGQEISGERAGG